MTNLDLTNGEFDPSSLRVAVLRNLLTENNISWSSRLRKQDLVDLVKYELIPKLKRAKRSTKKKQTRHPSEKLRDKGVSAAVQPLKATTTSIDSHKGRITKQEHTPAKKNPDVWKSLALQAPQLAVEGKEITQHQALPKKRKHEELKPTTDADSIYSPALKKTVKRKRVFSKPQTTPVSEGNIQNTGSNTETINGNGEIKSTAATVIPEIDAASKNIVDNKAFPHLQSTHARKTEPPFVDAPEIKQEEPSLQYGEDSTVRVKHENVSNDSGDISTAKYFDTSVEPIANSTFNELNLDDQLPPFKPISDIAIVMNDTCLASPIETTPQVPLGNTITGPTRRIDTVEVENSIKVKLEKLHELRNEISDDLKLIQNSQGGLTNTFTDTANTVKTSTGSETSTKNLTFDNDSILLTQLQNEFELENSRIELESEKVLEMINTKEKFKHYKYQFIRIGLAWVSAIFLAGMFTIYRQERIRVGFCGHEIRNNSSFVNKLFNLHLACVKCPEHSTCYPNSELACLPGYILSQPLAGSLWGILPTFNKCILDSSKVRKINHILKYVINLLAQRNADYKCGEGSDEEVGLDWAQITEMVDQKLMIDTTDQYYPYYWNKVKLILTTRTDIKFNSTDDDKPLIRSLSLSRLSFKCRLRKVVIAILLKYKMYLMSIVAISFSLAYVFYKVNQLQTKKELFRSIEKEIINKLQKQALDSRTSKLHPKKPYMVKIQLRDYYMPQLETLSAPNRREVWNKVVKAIESNSNVNSSDVEVNGDIMRVWTWSSDV